MTTNLKINSDIESTTIVRADLALPQHQQDVLFLTNAYAQDEMGNGRSLPPEVLDRLIPGLQAIPTSLIFLAYCNGQAVGIATCFIGFSTFAARPLINIHDLGVVPEYRGKGIGSALLRAVEQHALEMGCAKITLEVQENNHRARRVYTGAGFAQATLPSVQGGALFFTKILT